MMTSHFEATLANMLIETDAKGRRGSSPSG
jgi:hypothetical protein